MQENYLGQAGGQKTSRKAKPEMNWWSDKGCTEVGSQGTGGPGPEIEMNGGGFLSRPRPCMGCSNWEWV